MCRILGLVAQRPVEPGARLEAFARMCEASPEYQGHGWGCAWLENGRWREHHSITPIWEDELPRIPETTRFIAHARSAFQDKDITIENTMPFRNDERIFAFNGELRGVRIKADGRIGAEKIFNYILRFAKPDIMQAIRRAVPIIERRSEYIRAMNLIIGDANTLYVLSHFNEDEEYFTLHRKRERDVTMICSAPIDDDEWTPIPNRTIEVIA